MPAKRRAPAGARLGRLAGPAVGTWVAALFVGIIHGLPARAEAAPRTVDRAAVRFLSPETGGAGRPRFISERELSCLTRLEALIEEGDARGDYAERYRRTAAQRAVAETILEALLIQRAIDPGDLPAQTARLKGDLERRVGGAQALDAALRADGITSRELDVWLQRRVRAEVYVDRAVMPLSTLSDDELFAAFQVGTHPFRDQRFEDVRVDFARYLAYERLRRIAIDYLQSARSRVSVVFL